MAFGLIILLPLDTPEIACLRWAGPRSDALTGMEPQNIKIEGEKERLGALIECRRGRYYVGRSALTRKALYRVYYQAFLYNPELKPIGWLGSDKPYMTVVTAKTRNKLAAFLIARKYVVKAKLGIPSKSRLSETTRNIQVKASNLP